MNRDQTLSLIRSFLKLAGGALLAHGATKAAALVNAEDTAGLILTVIGFITSHVTHKDDSAGTTGIGTKLSALILAGALLAGPAVMTVALTGCGTTPAKITYDTLATIGASVDKAMSAAATAKAQGKLTDAQWASIADKHNKYLASYNTALDLAATATSTGLNTPAPADLMALGQDLVHAINTFTAAK